MLGKIKNILLGNKHINGLIKKIDSLPIAESGIDSDGDPYIRLENGTIFYGHFSSVYNYKYSNLSKTTKNVLNKKCLQVAADIIIRYVEGGLMYGGPKKQSRYSLKSGDWASEMGAYEGFCSIKLAQQVGPSGKIICIEPMKNNFRILTKNMKANNLQNVILINCAVWDYFKSVDISIRKNDNQSSSIEMNYKNANSYQIDANTLDVIYEKIEINKLDLIIIQLNGAEINALRGLKSFKPLNMSIAARYNTEGEDAALAIKNHLIKIGYHVEIDSNSFVFAKLIS